MSVLQGGVTEIYAKKELAGRPSTLIFRPSGEIHSDRFYHAGGRLFLVEIEDWWINRIREYSIPLNNSPHSYSGLLTTLVMKLYREFRDMDSVSALVVEGLMLEMIAEGSRDGKRSVENKPPRWIEQAKEILHSRFFEHVTLTDISHAIGVHPVHLGQMFRKFYRCTPGEYVRQLRVEFVCQELTKADTTLIDIALSAGFSDQSHLTRIFKRHTGITPARYRMLNRSV
jgi:AraC family transcriptional regulator